MEEEFILKQYGRFSKFEMALMTAEERQWHINRIKEEHAKQSQSNAPHVPKK